VTHVHNTSGECKTADNLLTLIELEKKFIEEDLSCILIGWVSDAGGELRAACIRLQSRYPWLLVTDCFVHQACILGDYIKKNPCLFRMAEASELISWFNNHSFALHVLFSEQRSMPEFGNVILTLIRAVITHWLTHVTSFNQLLRVSMAMKSAVLKHKDNIIKAAGTAVSAVSKAKEMVKIIENPAFWTDLEMISSHLEPLSIAINVCQGSHTRVDMVGLMFGQLYKHY
ncbi:hypothetical protein BS47DRAFT_1273897, partial [Hydnum rufescens UP504]